jgi:serine/threonine-protein kinase RsbW
MATLDFDRTMSDSDAGVREVRLNIPAKPEFITLCRLALTGISRLRPISDETLGDLKLALTEACSNSVRHAYADGDGSVEIVYRLHPDRLEVIVADDGEGFDPAMPVSEAEELAEGGLGIAIIRSIADHLEIGVGNAGRGSRLRFVKVLDA